MPMTKPALPQGAADREPLTFDEVINGHLRDVTACIDTASNGMGSLDRHVVRELESIVARLSVADTLRLLFIARCLGFMVPPTTPAGSEAAPQ